MCCVPVGRRVPAAGPEKRSVVFRFVNIQDEPKYVQGTCMYFIFSVEILVFSPNIHVLFYKYFSSSVTGFAHSSFALILARLDIRFFRLRNTSNTNLRWLFNKCILKEIPMG